MKDIPRHKGRKYIDSLVAQGEHDRQDFKFTISDARKIARSISAFANAAGGHLLIGIKDNGVVAGVRNEEDVFVVEQAAHLYCRPEVNVEFTAFSYDTNIVVIRAVVPKAAKRPVQCRDSDGHWRAYYRVADENIAAHPLMIRAWKSPTVDFSLTPETMRAIELLENAGTYGIAVRDVAHELSLSTRAAEEMLVGLIISEVAEFTYIAPHFRITRRHS